MKLSLIVNAITFVCVSAFAPISPTKSHSSTSLTMTWRDDNIITLVPKFKIKEGKKDAYMAVLPKFLEKVKANEQDTCVFYGFVGPSEDDHVICREGYVSAEGLLAHLANVDEELTAALENADIVDLMVQGPAAELEKLKEPLAAFNPTYYPMCEGSFRSTKN
jgi:quinol monooxygenase YgiN